MKWNNGYERRKFDAKQKRQAEEYRRLGMTEAQIAEMYRYDLHTYRANRIYAIHNQPLDECSFSDNGNDESDNQLFERYLDILSTSDDESTEHSRYWWLEQIKNPTFAQKLKELPIELIELITLYAYDGYTETEIANEFGVTKMAICKRLKKIKKILE